MDTLLLEMFDGLYAQLSTLLEARHRNRTSEGGQSESDVALLDEKIARLRHTIDRLQKALLPAERAIVH